MTQSTEQERAEFEQIMRKSPAYKPELMNRIGDRYEFDTMESAWQGFLIGIQAARRAQVVPHSGGVSLNFTRVTEALPELVEFNPNNSGEWSSRLVFVLGASGHIGFARLRIGGFNNKPETSELFQSADWQGDPRIIRSGENRVRSGDVVAWAYSEKIQESAMLAAAPQPPEAASVPVGTMCHGKAGELVPQWIMHADGLEIVFGCSCLLYKSERGIEVLRIDSGKGSCIKFGVPDTATEVLQPSGILHFHQTAASFCAEIAGESKSEAAPVQIPEPRIFWIEATSQFCIKRGGEVPFASAWEPLYTEHQVRQLLAARCIK